MQKPAALRDHLVAALPELALDPERLKMWLDKGQIRSRQTASFAFAYAYTLNIVITDWTRHPSIIMILILHWLRTNQPDLITSQSATGFRFEADVIDAATIDLSVELDLTESVGAVLRPDGGWDMQHHDEPQTMFPDDDPIIPSAPTLQEIWVDGARLIPDG